MEGRERTTTNNYVRLVMSGGKHMTPKEAESKLNNLMAQYLIALCSQTDIDSFINYIDVMWKYDAIPQENKHGQVRSYVIVDRSTFES